MLHGRSRDRAHQGGRISSWVMTTSTSWCLSRHAETSKAPGMSLHQFWLDSRKRVDGARKLDGFGGRRVNGFSLGILARP